MTRAVLELNVLVVSGVCHFCSCRRDIFVVIAAAAAPAPAAAAVVVHCRR